MPYYWTCPFCGSNLDPGERCNCNKSTSRPRLVDGASAGPLQQLWNELADMLPVWAVDRATGESITEHVNLTVKQATKNNEEG